MQFDAADVRDIKVGADSSNTNVNCVIKAPTNLALAASMGQE